MGMEAVMAVGGCCSAKHINVFAYPGMETVMDGGWWVLAKHGDSHGGGWMLT